MTAPLSCDETHDYVQALAATFRSDYRAGAYIATPNGPGYVDSILWDAGQLYVLVRHRLSALTGRSAGVCLTPHAALTGLWSYTRQELEAGGKVKEITKIAFVP